MSNKELWKKVLEHWERLAACTTMDEVDAEGYGRYQCAFCEVYNIPRPEEGGTACEGCPIAADTGRPFCQGTPYNAFNDAMESYSPFNDRVEPAPVDEAQAELAYLKDLFEREVGDG